MESFYIGYFAAHEYNLFDLTSNQTSNMTITWTKKCCLRVAASFRRHLLSTIRVSALEPLKVYENTSNMHENVVWENTVLTPIYGLEGETIELTCNCWGNVWLFPPNCGLDSISDGINFNLGKEQTIRLAFKIVSGSCRNHAKFCAINSVGFQDIGDGFVEFCIDYQRSSFNLFELEQCWLDFLKFEGN